MRALIRAHAASFVLLCSACGTPSAKSADEAAPPEPKQGESTFQEPPPLAGTASEPQASKPPLLLTQRLLFEPELNWEGGEKVRRGTAFVVQSGERCFITTTSHTLRFDGPALSSITLYGSEEEGALGAANLSWGRPGTGGTTERTFMDLNDDVLLLPCRSVPGGRAPVSFTEVADVQVGDEVWLPNRSKEAELGHEPKMGRITQITSGFVSVRFDSLKLQSQAGSPVLDEAGQLVGVFSRALPEKDGSTEVFLAPARAVWRQASSAEGVFPLASTVRDVGLGEAVSLEFGWKPGSSLEGLGRVAQDGQPAQIGQFTLEVQSSNNGLRVVRTDPTGKVVRRISSEGKFVSLEDAAAVTENSLQAAGIDSLPLERQEQLRKTLTPEVTTAAAESEWNRLVGEWVGAEFDLGRLYQKESQAMSPFGPGTVQVLTTVSAQQRTACDPEDDQLSCVKLLAHTSYDPTEMMEQLQALLAQAPPEERAGLEAELEGAQLEISVRRTLVTRPDTLVPVLSTFEKFVDLVGSREEYTLDERMYRAP